MQILSTKTFRVCASSRAGCHPHRNRRISAYLSLDRFLKRRGRGQKKMFLIPFCLANKISRQPPKIIHVIV